MERKKILTEATAFRVPEYHDEAPGPLVVRGWARSLYGKRERVLICEDAKGNLIQASVYLGYKREDRAVHLGAKLFSLESRTKVEALRAEHDRLWHRMHQIEKEIEGLQVEINPWNPPTEPNAAFKKRWAESLALAKKTRANHKAARRARKRKADDHARGLVEAKAKIMVITMTRHPKMTENQFNKLWTIAIAILQGHTLNTSKDNLLASMSKGLDSWEGKTRGGSGDLWAWRRIERILQGVDQGLGFKDD